MHQKRLGTTGLGDLHHCLPHIAATSLESVASARTISFLTFNVTRQEIIQFTCYLLQTPSPPDIFSLGKPYFHVKVFQKADRVRLTRQNSNSFSPLTGSNINGDCEENPQHYYYIWNRVPKAIPLNELQKFKGAFFLYC